ncbi:hypothetical protein RJ640_012895 [Escallonia rubra]|uniref:Uncharacterized protein n=1 Tax=Escallonia rubra TaxID=112253 RepID=A0AA88UGH0_9ASTE|nr:hypothetical protein RJ640_012895 [Escallonia rubra]
MSCLKVEITSRELIKPSLPTPHSLRSFKLSLLDQLSPFVYVPFIFFYAPFPFQTPEAKASLTPDLLRKSLSQVLAKFHPVAGQIKDNVEIECNDEGVVFSDAKVNCRLREILIQPEADVINHLLPSEYHSVTKSHEKVQFAAQVNTFSCGGMAIGMCFLHKIFDGSTISSFINAWAATARGIGESVLSPIFFGATLFPPRNLSGLFQFHSPKIAKAKCITKRFVFDGTKIALLREKVTQHSGLDRPSRTEVVSALIWKCAMEVQNEKSGYITPSVATQTVNLRPRMNPPLAGNSAGNILWLAMAVTPTSSVEGEIMLHDLVGEMRKEIRKFGSDYVSKMQGEDGTVVVCESFKERGMLCSKYKDVYRFTSLHHFPLYEVDFGWGKPAWISSAGMDFKNVIVLMDTVSSDGIEAWVTLDEQDMAIFEFNLERAITLKCYTLGQRKSATFCNPE